MTYANAERASFSIAGSAALRILIASYFISVSLGLIPGTNMSLLFSAVLPAPYDVAAAAGIVFVLAFMIMVSMYIRVAALCLALITIYASYLTMMQLGVAQELGAFWRDAALVAALMLTYSDHDGSRNRNRKLVTRQIKPRRIMAQLRDRSPQQETPSRASAQVPLHDGVSPRRTTSARHLGRPKNGHAAVFLRSDAKTKPAIDRTIENIFVFDEAEAA